MPEKLKRRSPGELGIVLGLDRAPEVKTLRKKLKEIGLRNKASEFISFLSKRWADQDKDVIGFAYIDGHVRPYNGRKHKLPKAHVARRHFCMPATTDFWINDANCEPLFFVTAQANDSLLSMLEKEVIPELKKLAGEGNRVTLVFDHEGWSPKSFEKWFKADIDVITYRKGKYDPWPEECFIEVESHVRGKAVKHLLAEHEIVRLETERKMFTDRIKMICYRAETCLLNLIAPFFARNNDEGRAFLKNVFQQPADIIPDKGRKIMNVKFHTMSTLRSNRALKQLCDVMNQESYVYPGSCMTLVFTTE